VVRIGGIGGKRKLKMDLEKHIKEKTREVRKDKREESREKRAETRYKRETNERQETRDTHAPLMLDSSTFYTSPQHSPPFHSTSHTITKTLLGGPIAVSFSPLRSLIHQK
jgi:hypothetical protein